MRFPLFALIAPLVTSIVLWLVTGSAFTLLFALLGPVMAVAQYVDGSLHAKRESRKQAERDDEEEIARTSQKQLESLALREETVRRNPSSSSFARSTHALRPLWAAGAEPTGEERVVRLGIARPAGLPVVLDVTLGIALRGAEIEVRSVLRAIAFQLAWKWGSQEIGRVGLDLKTEPELLPLLAAEFTATVSVCHVPDTEAIPLGFRYLLKVDRGLATLLDTVDGTVSPIELNVDLLTRAEANLILPKLLSEQSQSSKERDSVPHHAELILNTTGEWQSARKSLVVNVGRQKEFPLLVDLVTAGPHAVVTGMTGSGKTEFLKSWLVALAASYSPDELSFLVIDFKGGAGFSTLANLAHVVGVVTDLDHAQARRAISSLKAEMRFREQVLVREGVGDISDVYDGIELTRLIVLVDEYRAVLDAFPELLDIFVDLAARGRSLGIHVVLSSQRVGGALGDALLANCALRVGFRVSQKQDSLALLGNDSANLLPHVPGRAVLMGTGLAQREFQAAQHSVQDVEVVEAKTAQWRQQNAQWSPRSPWLPPLEKVIHPEEMPAPIAGVNWLGMADIPEHQVQSWVQYSPKSEGNVIITGPARSGVSNACRLIAQQHSVDVISDAERAWDAIVEEEPQGDPVLVIDDLDAVLDDFDLEHREEFVLCLTRVVRHAPKTGMAVILGCSEHVRGVTGLLALFPTVLTLESHNRPGRAQWRGHQVQLVKSEERDVSVAATSRLTFTGQNPYIVVTHRKREFYNAMTAEVQHRMTDITSEITVRADGEDVILMGTPDEWMSRSALLAVHKQRAVLVLDGCTSSELRGLRLRSGLFPHAGYGKTLVVEPDGSTTRVIL